MRQTNSWLAVGMLLVAVPGLAEEPKAITMILDTSGSMTSSDVPRYTVQITQIISDLLSDDDHLSAIRLPETSIEIPFCSGGPDPGLRFDLDTRHRGRFKEKLASGIGYGGGNNFVQPVRTAIADLERYPSSRRMLLMVADSGGLGSCDRRLTRDLVELHGEGVLIAAVNLGSSAGAFDGNPAFDFTIPALDSRGLLQAVGKVYQRFLGAKEVQSGSVGGDVVFDVAPQVRSAFLIVAADGKVGRLRTTDTNPGADDVALNYRRGSTLGLDRVEREYRTVRLDRPQAGKWRFQAPELRSSAGWLLIQEPIPLTLRLRDPGRLTSGHAAVLEADVVDADTGRRITDLSGLRGLSAELQVNGQHLTLRDDGTHGDRRAGDGVLSAELVPSGSGRVAMTSKLETDFLAPSVTTTDLEVTDANWALKVGTAESAEAGTTVPLRIELTAEGDAEHLPPVTRVEADAGGAVVELHDDGVEPDDHQADGHWAGSWSSTEPGDVNVTYSAFGDQPQEELARAEAFITVRGRLRMAQPPSIDLGRLGSGQQASGNLDLTSAEVQGDFEVRVTTDLSLNHTALELDPGSGWETLSSRPVALRLATGDKRTWPLRLRVGACPQGTAGSGAHRLVLEATRADGTPIRMQVPLLVIVEEDSWIQCWWPLLALLTGCAAAGVVIHGFVSPSRFGGRLGISLSEAEDDEGYFFPLRRFRAARSGFYRDASIHVRGDLRLSGKAAGAVARLRADGSRVRIRPMHGARVWRRSLDGDWEELPDDETTLRYGTLYRNDDETLYFELRNG